MQSCSQIGEEGKDIKVRMQSGIQGSGGGANLKWSIAGVAKRLSISTSLNNWGGEYIVSPATRGRNR